MSKLIFTRTSPRRHVEMMPSALNSSASASDTDDLLGGLFPEETARTYWFSTALPGNPLRAHHSHAFIRVPNAIYQSTGFTRRRNAKLCLEKRHQAFVLPQRRAALPSPGIQLDNALLYHFMQGFQSECRLTGGKPSLKVPRRYVMLHQPSMATQEQQVQPFTLCQDPVIVPAPEQIPFVMYETRNEAGCKLLLKFVLGRRERRL